MKTSIPKNKLKILDWYCHQGHQYEFFKTGHDFYLCGLKGKLPNWNEKHRPKNENVTFITESQANKMNFDVIMVRSPISIKRYSRFIKKGAKPVAVVQTTTHYPLHGAVKHVVWNSKEVMNKYKRVYPGRKHHYIVHGYDPDEFTDLDIQDNGRVLTVANVFKGRSKIMGYPLWSRMYKVLKVCDIVGHGNDGVPNNFGEAESMESLINIYNSYSLYFNPTIKSAMPRSRAEAAMCGMPIVTTDNFDISKYLKHRQDAIVSNNVSELYKGMNDLLKSKTMREDYGKRSREIAIKHFHIDDYIKKWNHLFGAL